MFGMVGVGGGKGLFFWEPIFGKLFWVNGLSILGV
jgi:hypothetical protein